MKRHARVFCIIIIIWVDRIRLIVNICVSLTLMFSLYFNKSDLISHKVSWSRTGNISYSIYSIHLQSCFCLYEPLTRAIPLIFSDLIPSKIQGGIDDTDPIPMLCTKTQHLSLSSSSVRLNIRSSYSVIWFTLRCLTRLVVLPQHLTVLPHILQTTSWLFVKVKYVHTWHH